MFAVDLPSSPKDRDYGKAGRPANIKDYPSEKHYIGYSWQIKSNAR